jgi:multidrug efflux pump subunit AcrA (membrane-fusion protein)
MLTAFALALVSPSGYAHEGQNQATAAATPAGPVADAAMRLPDGSVHLSKPIQRLLGLRTIVVQPGVHPTIVELAGRVVADPNRSARVQALRDGIVQPSEKGLPFVGQKVAKDQVLVTLVGTLTPAEESQLRQKLVEIEREIALLLPRAEHASVVNPNMPMGDAAVALLQEIQIQSQAMARQADVVKAALNAKVEIKAPIAGVIGSSSLAIGQMVGARETLVEIVAEGPPRIEAYGFGTMPASLVGASTSGENGRRIELEFLGRGPVLRGNAVALLFQAKSELPGAEIGRLLKVQATTREKVSGMLVPRTALQRLAGGNFVLWEQTEPERFMARPVVIAPHDGGHVVVTGGIAANARIVVDGAAFVSQVR